MKTALVVIANGSEEIEAVTIINVLFRAGVTVTTASVQETEEITGSRGIKIVADVLLKDIQTNTYDLIAIPGGMPGAEHLRDSADLISMLKQQKETGKIYAAICASPAVVFQTHGLLDGRKACCYPCFKLKPQYLAEGTPRVVVSENCVTSVGPASAMEFSLKLVELLVGGSKAKEIAEGLLYQGTF